MKYGKFLVLFCLLLAATGCAKTKFNRGVSEIPGDAMRLVERDYEKFNTLDEDIARRARYAYERSEDGANDVARWVGQEWQKSEENMDWLLVKTGEEFEIIRGAGAYIERRWKNMGPKMKGLWRDTYSIISYELEHTASLDDEAKRHIQNELERVGTASEGFRRWRDNRVEEWTSLRAWMRKVYSRESEKGEDALKSIKDYFTKEIK